MAEKKEDQIDYQRYLRLVRKARSGKVLTQDELSYIIEFKQDVDQGAIDKVKNSEEFKKLSPEEQGELTTQALDASTKLLFQDPAYKETILNLAREAEKGKLSEKITTGLNVALAGSDIISSIGQIQTGKNAARRSRRPGRPAPLTASPELANAITQAQQGNFDSVRALAPAQLAILDNYLSDLGNARTASTGQAGTYGALGQVASNRRNRANVELAPVADQITARNQSRLDDLLAMKLAENQAINRSQSQMYPYDLEQYQLEQQTAADTGAAGRQNLLTSTSALASFLPKGIAELATQKRYEDAYNNMIQYGQNNADLAGKTSNDIAGRFNNMTRIVDPEYLDQIYR